MRLAHLRCLLFGHCWFEYTHFGKPLSLTVALKDGGNVRRCRRCDVMEDAQ